MAANKKLARKTSLRAKIILLVAAAMCVIALAMTGISYVNFRDAALEEQTAAASGAAKIAQSYIDGDRVNAYLEQGENAEEYRTVSERLKMLQEYSGNIAHVFVYRIGEDGFRAVFAPGTDAAPGETIPMSDALLQHLPALLKGERIEPVIADEAGGRFLYILEPVYDSQGECQCYAAVYTDMESTVVSGYQFLARVLSLFFGFFIMMLTVTIWMVEYSVILPINAMAITTGQSPLIRSRPAQTPFGISAG
jgi:hypothetical protein